MPSDYEVRLRRLPKAPTAEKDALPVATKFGQTKTVMGITSPGTYEQLDSSKHRKKNSDTDIVWLVHGDPDAVFAMIAEWRRHSNIEVTLIKETNTN
jgi:hypothetical protein